ncbi:SOS response-associated peptidase family protein [Haloferula sargassicola]|uniref:Abasic site processing protein n=1 Tax=Haloferula sargassicola TaxID=490096 RepID=A0ABP9UUD3_9BACT
MCNAYNIHPKTGAKDLDALVTEKILRLPSRLVRRSAAGVAVIRTDDGLEPAIMRWGFPHPKWKIVNNARSESLSRGMWVEPLERHRCLVPMSSFYEWQELPGGGKQPHELRHPDADWLWVAGLYQPTEEHGPCFATITTEPTPAVARVHDRLLAIVDFEEGMAFLRGEKSTFSPYPGPLLIEPCKSPLKSRKPKPDDPQGSLF